MNKQNLVVIAVLIDLILLVVFVTILGLSFASGIVQEPVFENTETATLISSPTETPLPTLTPTCTPTLTPTPTESPTLTPIPSPTRILPEEPTKVPYIFQTPVFIPPNMRDLPTLTPTRTRTR